MITCHEKYFQKLKCNPMFKLYKEILLKTFHLIGFIHCLDGFFLFIYFLKLTPFEKLLQQNFLKKSLSKGQIVYNLHLCREYYPYFTVGNTKSQTDDKAVVGLRWNQLTRPYLSAQSRAFPTFTHTTSSYSKPHKMQRRS